jgi:hypothetical protein
MEMAMTFVGITRRPSIAAAAATLMTVLAGGAAAQSVAPAPTFSVHAGAFQYDLSGVGTTPMVAVRADFPLGRIALVEGSVGGARPDQQFGERTTLMIPEAQLQFQLPLGRVLPYIGAGGGAFLDFRSGENGGLVSAVTGSVAGGVRAWVTPRVGLRAELRVRGIGSRFTGAAAEWTGGLSWRP